jgi:hypothetical protein
VLGKRLRRFALVAVAALSLAVPASAAVQRNDRFEFDQQVFVVCADDVIDVHGVMHVLSRVEEDAAGGVHLGSTVTVHFTGRGADGTRYVGGLTETTQIRMSTEGGATTHTETIVGRLIRVGDGRADANDLRSRLVFHFTMDANGRLTVSLARFTAECA